MRPASDTVRRRWRAAVYTMIVLVALAARIPFFAYKSGDYVDFVHGWYNFIQQHGGFRAQRYVFANYNVPYLYLLTAATYLPVSPLIAVKIISVVFDGILAWFVYRILRFRYPSGWRPVAGATVVVLLPTIVLNSSMWGQSDSTYSAFAVGGVYWLLRRKHWLACAFFGLALAFKLQIVFLFPALLVLVLRKRLPWRPLAAIPGVYLLLDVPAFLLGANPHDLLLVYVRQTMTNDQFTMSTPNVYQYLEVAGSGTTWSLEVLAAVLVVLALIVVIVVRRVTLTDSHVTLVATVSVLLVPFLLPKMHERYFYLADVLTVVTALWLPQKLWHVPVLTQFASLFSYLPFLLLPYRLRDMTGNAAIADRSGFVEPHTMTESFQILGAQFTVPELLSRAFPPVVDFRILTTALLLALISMIITTARDLGRAERDPFCSRTLEVNGGRIRETA